MCMNRLAPLILAGMILTGCSALQGKPVPPPPATDSPQEIQHNQTSGLHRAGTVSAIVHGSPMDSEAAIKEKAEQAKADYYVILFNSDTMRPGQWYIQAILYNK